MTTVILGGANTVFSDLDRFLDGGGTADHVIAVNHVGFAYPGRVDIWATLHPELMDQWLRTRAAAGYALPKFLAAHRELNSHESQVINYPSAYVLISQDRGGSSGLLATYVAMQMWPDPVVLCGLPYEDDKAHFYSDVHWTGASQYRNAWFRDRAVLETRVSSMSGWTRDLFTDRVKAWPSIVERKSNA